MTTSHSVSWTTPPPTKTIQKELFNTWNYHTQKNGFKSVSRKGVSVYLTEFTNHSGSMEIKSIEEQTDKYGTTEYWENELYKSVTDKDYTNPHRTPQDIEEELKKFRLSVARKKY